MAEVVKINEKTFRIEDEKLEMYNRIISGERDKRMFRS